MPRIRKPVRDRDAAAPEQADRRALLRGLCASGLGAWGVSEAWGGESGSWGSWGVQPKQPQPPLPVPKDIGPQTPPALTPGTLPVPALDLGWSDGKKEFVLPALPFATDALEPYLDKPTLEVHHARIHAAHVVGLNRALAELGRIRRSESDAALVAHWSRELSFHAAGHFAHCAFWRQLAPSGKGGGGEPTGLLMDALMRDFGGFDRFLAHFKSAAERVEGDGWVWLMYLPPSRGLVILQVRGNQDGLVPFGVPLLGIDVWEHAYAAKYQHRRGDYVNALLNVLNWGAVQALYSRAIESR